VIDDRAACLLVGYWAKVVLTSGWLLLLGLRLRLGVDVVVVVVAVVVGVVL